MKKKVFLFALTVVLCLTGCSSLSDKDIRKDFIKDVEGLNAYYLEGTLKLTNNDDSYEYDVKTSYKKNDNYKVSLTNKANNYEQIILKNQDSVYVINPSLNKSFKFQSDWPNNNSQSYLLDSVANDLKSDNDYSFTKKDNDYVFTTKTNYPNNPKYTKQNIILDKDKNLKKVEVLDDEGIIYVEFTVNSLDKKASFDAKTFDLEEVTKSLNVVGEDAENQDQTVDDENSEREESNESNNDSNSDVRDAQGENDSTEETADLDDTVFPLYLPTNTSLSDKEVIETTDGQRIIMTFSGDNPFILVQETVKPSDSLEIVPTYGEPFMLIDTVGSLTDTSYTWTSNGVEYYIVSDVMDQGELLEVAKSINVVSTISEK